MQHVTLRRFILFLRIIIHVDCMPDFGEVIFALYLFGR